jgi:hypothetical protein
MTLAEQIRENVLVTYIEAARISKRSQVTFVSGVIQML